jgi:hypothetical protein
MAARKRLEDAVNGFADIGDGREGPEDDREFAALGATEESGFSGGTFQGSVGPPVLTGTRIKVPGSEKATEDDPGKVTVGKNPFGNTQKEKELLALAGQLETKLSTLFGYTSAIFPVTGTHGVKNSDKAALSLCAIARRRPKVMAGLQKFADAADSMEIFQYILGLATAFAVDVGRLPEDHMAVAIFGVAETIAFMESQMADSDVHTNDSVLSMPVGAHAVRFQPV